MFKGRAFPRDQTAEGFRTMEMILAWKLVGRKPGVRAPQAKARDEAELANAKAEAELASLKAELAESKAEADLLRCERQAPTYPSLYGQFA